MKKYVVVFVGFIKNVQQMYYWLLVDSVGNVDIYKERHPQKMLNV